MEADGFTNFIHTNYFGKKRYQVLCIVWALAAVFILCYGHVLAVSSYPILGAIVAGIGRTQVGWVLHHAGHVGVFGVKKIDDVIMKFCHFLVGTSSVFWNKKHNRHHASTNVSGVDTDVDTSPLFAWDSIEANKCPSCLLKIQHLLFFPIMATGLVYYL